MVEVKAVVVPKAVVAAKEAARREAVVAKEIVVAGLAARVTHQAVVVAMHLQVVAARSNHCPLCFA